MTILEEAQKAVVSRRKVYGDSMGHHALTAQLWGAYLGRDITATEVAILMVLDKVARQRNDASYRDSYVDMCGYSACAAHNAGIEE